MSLDVELFVDGKEPAPTPRMEWGDVSNGTPVAIVGGGPAGLFAALRLIERGFKPIIIERGKDVSARKHDIAALNRNEGVNPESNYCFGEGGAGTYSDGKLYTRSKKRGDYKRALTILHLHGAPEEILYDSHPHIGTDKLPSVIAAIRDTIIASGGVIMLENKVCDLIIKNNRCLGVIDSHGTKIEAKATILATGHSARDIYELLNSKGIALEAKSFAMGLRVEHPQTLIDKIQYRQSEGRGEWLPPASYNLTAQIGGRGVYSFCMCPGGFIVPSATAQNESVVNGMSPSGRNSKYANSGIVTECRPSDYAYLVAEHGILAGMRFQQMLEESAYKAVGQGVKAPGQRLTEFTFNRPTTTLPGTSFHPGVEPSLMSEWLPNFIYSSLSEGFKEFDKKMHGFLTKEAIVLGVESRTSSPLRIPRDKDTLEHIQIAGLYPAAEGAGYAGGIISAAMDGERIAEKIGL